jgi:hypothetical protein
VINRRGVALRVQDCWQAIPRTRPSFTEIIARLEAMLGRWSQQAAAAAGAQAH